VRRRRPDTAQEAAKAALGLLGRRAALVLGVLRPTPMAPGTHRYRVRFAVWESEGDGYDRRDVHELMVWAADAASARRLAHQEIQSVPEYRPVWRVRQVVRSDPA
jgi:hypothetical protein